MNFIDYISVNWEGIWRIIDTIVLITLPFIITVVIIENRNPVKTIGWLLVIIFLPAIGIVLYFYFGRNFRKRKIFNRKAIFDLESADVLIKNQISNLDDDSIIIDDEVKKKQHIIKLLLNNNKALLTGHNNVEIYNNGEDTFTSIKQSLLAATHHIHLEYYIIEDDVIGNQIKDILIEKAKQGVAVRLIFDDVGSWSLKKEYIEELKVAGVEVHSFLPVRIYRLAIKINYRNHRKIIVVDGKTAFVGGMNIADRYIEGNEELGAWRDTHLMLEGNAVRSLQSVFLIDWYFVSQKIINGDNYFPDISAIGNNLVQIATSGPDSDWASIMQAYFYAIATANKYVYISSPYLIPNSSILTALKTASLAGVDVRILIPEKTDNFFVSYGTQAFLEELLEAGVKVFRYNKGFTHSKLMIVDDVFSSVGTANMDIRSFSQNFEVNAIIYSSETATELKAYYLSDIDNSTEVNYAEFVKRPVIVKIRESIAKIFSPLL